MDPETIGLLSFAGGVVLTAALQLLRKFAPGSENKIDDRALEILERIDDFVNPDTHGGSGNIS